MCETSPVAINTGHCKRVVSVPALAESVIVKNTFIEVDEPQPKICGSLFRANSEPPLRTRSNGDGLNEEDSPEPGEESPTAAAAQAAAAAPPPPPPPHSGLTGRATSAPMPLWTMAGESSFTSTDAGSSSCASYLTDDECPSTPPPPTPRSCRMPGSPASAALSVVSLCEPPQSPHSPAALSYSPQDASPGPQFSNAGGHVALVTQLPQDCGRHMMVLELENAGFRPGSDFDMISMPMCPQTAQNMGFCYISFFDASVRNQFLASFQDKVLRFSMSQHGLAVAKATVQDMQQVQSSFGSEEPQRPPHQTPFCTTCGTEAAPAAQFCTYCGTSLQAWLQLCNLCPR